MQYPAFKMVKMGNENKFKKQFLIFFAKQIQLFNNSIYTQDMNKIKKVAMRRDHQNFYDFI